jgi:3-oxoacyl-(acyl-carrier-protein) synthase
MLPRVVITGMGVVSPNGIGKEEFCRAILAGKSGVKRISRFDPSCLPVQIAGEIRDGIHRPIPFEFLLVAQVVAL